MYRALIHIYSYCLAACSTTSNYNSLFRFMEFGAVLAMCSMPDTTSARRKNLKSKRVFRAHLWLMTFTVQCQNTHQICCFWCNWGDVTCFKHTIPGVNCIRLKAGRHGCFSMDISFAFRAFGSNDCCESICKYIVAIVRAVIFVEFGVFQSHVQAQIWNVESYNVAQQRSNNWLPRCFLGAICQNVCHVGPR